MLCDLCKQNVATVHLSQLVDGKTKKIDLCEACSKAKGVDDPAMFSIADMLLGLGAAQELEQASASSELRCPNCGFTHADFKKAGRFGCSDCYAAFADGLEGLLKTMHNGIRHAGKVPQAYRQGEDVGEKIKSLQKMLRKAIETENYEQAATLRDQIKRLESSQPA
jgi:protein arginine kinase activator